MIRFLKRTLARRYAACGSATGCCKLPTRSTRKARSRSYDGWSRVGGLHACLQARVSRFKPVATAAGHKQQAVSARAASNRACIRDHAETVHFAVTGRLPLSWLSKLVGAQHTAALPGVRLALCWEQYQDRSVG